MSKFRLYTTYGTTINVTDLTIVTVVEEISTVHDECKSWTYKTQKGFLNRIYLLTGKKLNWKTIQDYRVE